jgi:hypothetical protein
MIADELLIRRTTNPKNPKVGKTAKVTIYFDILPVRLSTTLFLAHFVIEFLGRPVITSLTSF